MVAETRVDVLGDVPKAVVEVRSEDPSVSLKLDAFGVFFRVSPVSTHPPGKGSGHEVYRAPYSFPLMSILCHYLPGCSPTDVAARVLDLEESLVGGPERSRSLAQSLVGVRPNAFPVLLFLSGKEHLYPIWVRLAGERSIVLVPDKPGLFGELPAGLYDLAPTGWMYVDEEELSDLLATGMFSEHGVYVLPRFDWGLVTSPLFRRVLDRALSDPSELQTSLDPSTEAALDGLWKHQKRGVLFLRHLMDVGYRGGMLAFDMGTGKTRTALAFASSSGAKRVLVVCPKSVAPTWVREANRWYPEMSVLNLVSDESSQYKAYALSSFSSSDAGPYLVVVNYDSVIREPLLDALRGVSWDLLVLDESHFVKNHESKRFRALKEVPRSFTLALSGTPMVQGPLDIWSQAYLLDPRFLGKNYYAFRNTYAVLGGYKSKQVVGYRRINRLKAKMKKFSMFVSVDDVIELPDYLDEKIEVELSQESRWYYNLLYQRFLEAASGVSLDRNLAATYIIRMQQLTGGYYYDEQGGEARVGHEKEEALKDLLSSLPRNEPVVVFAVFRRDIENILKVASELDIPSSELSGRVNQLGDFVSGKSRLIAVQIKAGGVGIDLSRARYAVYYSLGYSYGDYAQSRARVRRPGQKRKVFYYHLIAKDTVDESVYRALARKEDVIDEVVSELRLFQRE